MKFLELKNISEQFMELANPISPEKIIKVGRVVGLKTGSRVIDFGCGYGEALLLWADKFGISGEGVDIRPYACQRALNKVAAHGLTERIEICCGDAASYVYPPHSFDLAACIGATFIWGDFAAAVHAMKEAILPTGRLAIGEAYWLTDDIPTEYRKQQAEVRPENELLQMARQEGFDFEYVIRASHDDWDNYESGNWFSLLHWIEENPDHPERQQVIDHLHESQDEYTRYAREYFGWAIYILKYVWY